MTISSLLGSVTSATPGSRFEMSGGPSPMADTEIFHHVDRGAYAHGHGGGKGVKGIHSAMSAITLLAFLFFINLLQTCIQENMMTTGATMLMLVAANRSGPLVRPSRDIHQHEDTDTNVLPGPGLYRDTNVLIRQKGDPGTNGWTQEQDTTRLSSVRDTQYANDTVTDHVAESSARDKDDYTDGNDNGRDLFSKNSQLKSKKHYLEADNELSTNTNSFLHKELHASGEERADKAYELSSSEGYLSDACADPDHTKYNEYYELNDDSNHWGYDHYDQYESATHEDFSVMRNFFPTAEPSNREFVNRNDLTESENLYPFTNFGNFAWRIVASVSKPAVQRLHSSLGVAHCYELVVCEAHRVAGALGHSGTLLASGFSEIVMWLYGRDEEHRRLITEAAATGRERQSCKVQMQQCEDKSRGTSALPVLATILYAAVFVAAKVMGAGYVAEDPLVDKGYNYYERSIQDDYK